MAVAPFAESARSTKAVDLGSALVMLAGGALVVYGLLFLIRNFSTFIELGLTPAQIGATPEEIRSFSPRLYNYVSHLHVAIAGFIVTLGVGFIALGWNGLRHGMRWAGWTVLLMVMTAVGIALPLHYVYGLATLGHLGSLYAAVVALIAGTLLSPAMRRQQRA